MSIEEILVEKLNTLPLDKQQKLLAFAESLVQEAQVETHPLRGAWRNHPAIGMWKDRSDMEDSVAWVKALRRQQWERLGE
ncbi:hypothetical protein ACQ4M3_13855 [Leptolyngbya sp. AN03gr2]|uniref:hypothetical protein n=1 Tax=unclassified Leptolyngbya TaxID=2650499 RepID=UPI003D31CDBA